VNIISFMSRKQNCMKRKFLLLIQLFVPVILLSQTFAVIDNYVRINATASDPLYNTYAPTLSRSEFPEANVYKFDYYSDSCLISYSGSKSGTMFSFWEVDGIFIRKTGDYFRKPRVIYSFPDMVIAEYEPVKGITVRETFLVYSSKMAVVDMEVTNTSTQSRDVSIYPALSFADDSVEVSDCNYRTGGILAKRGVSHGNITTGQESNFPHKDRIAEFFTGSSSLISFDYLHCRPADFSPSLISVSHEMKPDSQNMQTSVANFLVLHQKRLIRPKETITFRYIHGVQSQQENTAVLINEATKLKSCFLKTFFEDNLMLFLNVPRITFSNPKDKLVYISSLNLSRTSVYPASGTLHFNFFTSHSNPESTKTLDLQLPEDAPGLMGYVYLDPKSAENSFRNFTEQLDQNIEKYISRFSSYNGNTLQPEFPAGFLSYYNWTGMEIYKVSRDKQFLKETYIAGSKLIDYLNEEKLNHQQKKLLTDLCLVKEERCLSWMAMELGRKGESAVWRKKALAASALVEACIFNDTTGFFSFSGKQIFSSDNKEGSRDYEGICAGLILWAGIGSKELDARLNLYKTDTLQSPGFASIQNVFSGNSPRSGKTNDSTEVQQPVKLLNIYMLYDGLRKQGFSADAKQLADKIVSCVSSQLSRNHNFWENYQPDTDSAGGIVNYFPDSILIKLLFEDNVK
jgi:hypothetical protein